MKPKELVKLWVEAFNNGDAKEISKFYHKDAVNLQVRGCGFFHIIDDRIIFQRGYWDKLSFLRMHDLPIPEK